MASWGVGIFDDDLAQLVRAEFERHVRDGMSVYMAADRVQTDHANADTKVVTLALAVLQLEHNTIQPKIRKKALTIIISGDGKERWENGDPSALAARERELQNLRERLRDQHT
jgi:hypothetical protein